MRFVRLYYKDGTEYAVISCPPSEIKERIQSSINHPTLYNKKVVDLDLNHYDILSKDEALDYIIKEFEKPLGDRHWVEFYWLPFCIAYSGKYPEEYDPNPTEEQMQELDDYVNNMMKNKTN